MKAAALFFALLFTLSAHAQDVARFLLPIAVAEVPGANGSLWSSELWIHSSSDTDVVISPVRISNYSLRPRETERVPISMAEAGHPPGLFLLVMRADAAKLHFNLRIRDFSRAHASWGTEIPVIAEEAFLANPLVLPLVPLGGGFRSMLRIYGINNGEVRVIVTRIGEGSVLSRVLFDEVVALRGSSDGAVPAYAALPLPTDLGQARVEIEPLTSGLHYWAFVSITHNETQHVTTVTPQQALH